MNKPKEETALRRDNRSAMLMQRFEQHQACASMAKSHETSDGPCKNVRVLSLPATI